MMWIINGIGESGDLVEMRNHKIRPESGLRIYIQVSVFKDLYSRIYIQVSVFSRALVWPIRLLTSTKALRTILMAAL